MIVRLEHEIRRGQTWNRSVSDAGLGAIHIEDEVGEIRLAHLVRLVGHGRPGQIHDIQGDKRSLFRG